MKKCLKLLFNLLIYVLMFILISYLGLRIYGKLVNPTDNAILGKYYVFQIASSSMETNLHIGDYIVVKRTDDLKKGDVITFQEDGVYITHRIHEIDGDKIVTKGDANQSLDDSIDKTVVLGKVLFKASILSFLVKYKFIIVSILIGLFILEYVFCENKMEEVIDEEIKNDDILKVDDAEVYLEEDEENI